jgi:hypothetical protein
MAYSAIMQKLKYHAKNNGLIIRKIDGDNYILADNKKISADVMTLDELKEKILNLQFEKLKNNFAV